MVIDAAAFADDHAVLDDAEMPDRDAFGDFG